MSIDSVLIVSMESCSSSEFANAPPGIDFPARVTGTPGSSRRLSRLACHPGSDLVLQRVLLLVVEPDRDGGDRASALQEPVDGVLAGEVALERRAVVAGGVAERPEAAAELLR